MTADATVENCKIIAKFPASKSYKIIRENFIRYKYNEISKFETNYDIYLKT